MTNLTKTLIRLIFLFVLWTLVRFTLFCLEVSELNWEACAVSGAEDHLIVKMRRQLKALTPKFIKA
ncbi:hypothetical protein Lepto7375DRAFT_1796 [Leptolyngbya sp. PCC 7375]|nr:hypothetical protein Lepto7375DRAFT_1796 [Leptolyngbya sp. PCC 7375]